MESCFGGYFLGGYYVLFLQVSSRRPPPYPQEWYLSRVRATCYAGGMLWEKHSLNRLTLAGNTTLRDTQRGELCKVPPVSVLFPYVFVPFCVLFCRVFALNKYICSSKRCTLIVVLLLVILSRVCTLIGCTLNSMYYIYRLLV